MVLPESPIEKGIVDRLTVGQRHHTEDAGRGLAGTGNLAPEAKTSIGLLLTTDRRGDYLSTPSRVDIGSLGAHLFLEVSRRLHTTEIDGARWAVNSDPSIG